VEMTNSQNYHIPVLLHDAVNGLNIKSDGCYVDVTFGGGGHAKEVLNKLTTGKLVGFDQDPDAIQNIPESENFIFVPQNFRFIRNHLRMQRLAPVDGILADLGVSSWQFDQGERGFSFRFEGPLDMRMSQTGELTAAKIINSYDVDRLTKVFREYGEINEAYSLARKLEMMRVEKSFTLIEDLDEVLEGMNHNGKKAQFKAKVFQALRIEVNEEIQVIKEMLESAVEVLKPGGRLVVISYHSLEDRLVKNFIKKGKFEGELEKDFFGNPIRPLKQITRKPILPSEEEIENNPRARSAKLRVAEKI
jgi:16S rRNA (cytosine1402-N4)-methyltransferase